MSGSCGYDRPSGAVGSAVGIVVRSQISATVCVPFFRRRAAGPSSALIGSASSAGRRRVECFDRVFILGLGRDAGPADQNETGGQGKRQRWKKLANAYGINSTAGANYAEAHPKSTSKTSK